MFFDTLMIPAKHVPSGFFQGASAPPRFLLPYFLQSLVFHNHFEELQTMLFEVELIINNARLI